MSKARNTWPSIPEDELCQSFKDELWGIRQSIIGKSLKLIDAKEKVKKYNERLKNNSIRNPITLIKKRSQYNKAKAKHAAIQELRAEMCNKEVLLAVVSGEEVYHFLLLSQEYMTSFLNAAKSLEAKIAETKQRREDIEDNIMCAEDEILDEKEKLQEAMGISSYPLAGLMHRWKKNSHKKKVKAL